MDDVLTRIEQLKSRLAAEGLFSAEHKTEAPFLPGEIGLMYGRNTKTRENILINVLGRWPATQFNVREVRVRGEGATKAMIEALESLKEALGVDVVVFVRGGGSVEGLLPSLDERLMRAVAKTRKPVVSAIGHESDSLILDLVTDLWASAPIDAAKRIVPDVAKGLAAVAEMVRRGRSTVQTGLDRAQDELDSIRARLALAFPETIINMREENLLSLTRWVRTHADYAIADAADELAAAVTNLRALFPRVALDRGYSILLSKGSVISGTAAARKGQEIEAILARGRLVLAVAAVTGQDGAVAEEGLAVNQNNLTAATP